MTTSFIAGKAVPLATIWSEGDLLDEIGAIMLNDIQHKRVKAKLRYLLQRGEIDANSLQAKADELMSQELSIISTDDDEDDPIIIEAIEIAKELINKRMAAEGLPPPKGIELHAKALVEGVPEISERARLRVEARYRAASETLSEAT